MEYVCLGLALLLGGSYVVCSIAEFFLWIFERPVSDNFTPEFGDGTTRSSPTLAPITQPSPKVRPVSKPGILIVDDHPRYRRILERWFLDHGFRVWTASDGREGVEVYRAHAEDIGIALLDVYMAGLDGPATMAALQRESPTIACCLMTAEPTAEKEAQWLALGADYVFEKPLLLLETTTIISELLNESDNSPLPIEYLWEDQQS